jgi:hypothetical protein
LSPVQHGEGGAEPHHLILVEVPPVSATCGPRNGRTQARRHREVANHTVRTTPTDRE